MRRLALLACCASIAAPVSASAQGVQAPPGNSAVSQYFETVPAAGGGQAPTHGRSVSRAVERRLQASGTDGRALARALNAAPGPPAARKTASGTPSRAPGPSFSDRSSVKAQPTSTSLAKPVVGDGGPTGSGAALPIFLLVSALGAAAIALRRVAARRAAP